MEKEGFSRQLNSNRNKNIMDKPTVLQIASLFLNYPLEEINLLDWRFKNNEIEIKIEEKEDGMIYVYRFGVLMSGPAKTGRDNDFSIIA